MKYLKETLAIVFLLLLFYTHISAQSSDKIKDEIWQRELQYWKYVEQNDRINYLSLWHKDFIGYPGTDSLTGKNTIADWITDVHTKKDLRYEYELVKKLVNPFGEVVITFYDETDIWKNTNNEIVSKETYKITHTWKKYGKAWLIIGGMSARKKN